MKTQPAAIAAFLLKKLTAYFCTFILVLTAMHSLAQAPSFSYATPQTFTTGVTITPLAPTNTGGAVPPNLTDTLTSGAYISGRIAADPAGNIYVLDNGMIKKIPASGGTPIVIGTGFYWVEGIAADAAGNVYTTNLTGGSTGVIEKIPANGDAIDTVGPMLYQPLGIAVDKSGNIYFTDGYGLNKMSAEGGTPVLLVPNVQGKSFFDSLCVDNGGNIYFADSTSGNLYERVASTGSIIFLASNSTDNIIAGIAVDKYGKVYYSRVHDRYITRLTLATGEKNTVGSELVRPLGIALDATGRIYVGCTYIDVVRITWRGYIINRELPPGLSFDGNTGIISGTPTLPSVASNYTITASNHSGTYSSTVNLSVTATIKPSISYSNPGPFHQNNEIMPLAPANTGGAITTANQKVLVPNLNSPSGVTVDGTGNVYYIESQTAAVKMIPAVAGKPLLIGSGFTAPLGIGVDGAGNVYVNEAGGQSIMIIVAGGYPIWYFCTGKFNAKVIAVDSAGNVYIARADIGEIMRCRGDGNGPVKLALIKFKLAGMATDHAGNLYITTTTGDIKEIKAGTNTIIDLASTNTQMVSAAVDDSGNVYYLEHTNNTLSMYLAATGKVIVLANGLSGSFGAAVDANRFVYVTGKDLAKITTSGYYVDKPLPAGLVMDKSTGIISGTPTASSVADTYTVTALNSGGSSSSSFSLSVSGVSNNSLLSDLTPGISHLGPSFKSETLDYSTNVASSVTSITFTPTTADSLATVTVNGVTVASGTASAAIPLTTGDNAVHIIVTATNGSKTTYSVLVTRLASSNYYLATLLTSHGILSPTFTHLTNSYTTQVGAYVASLNVTPTTVDSTATITVNGTPLASGATSAEIPLTVGVNPINIAVTAQNGTVNTYIINVTRVPSTNAYLMRILLNHGYDVPLFSHLIFNYATPVPNGVSAIKVTPIGAVSSSTITVNGTIVASSTASGDIPLAVGVNNISILVTAQDGVTQNTYTVSVTREPPSLNTVYQPVSVATTNGLNQLNEDGILVHSGLSPNGDGINDFLLIDGIANYPENKLQIMTRNGQLIFEAKNYDNSNKVFDGHSNKNGTMQLPGTYFYSLDYTVNGVVKHKTGFVVLKY